MKTEQRKQLSFKGQNIYIGIDVHLKSWSVTLMSRSMTLKTFSQDADPGALATYLKRTYPDADYHSVYEAGFCGFSVHEKLTELGIHNIVVNPADIPTTNGERVRKTDPVDSAKLARGLRSGELKGIYIPDREAQEIRSLIRLRDLITKDQTRQKNRIKSHLRFFGIEIPERFSIPGCCWSSAFIRWMRSLEESRGSGKETPDFLTSHHEAIRQERLEMLKPARQIARSEKYDRKIQLLMSVPGIGQMTAVGLLSEIIDIERFSNAEHPASYIGMIPMCHCSGAHDENGDITVRRNGRLRASMTGASWVAIRDDEALLSCHEDYCRRMKRSKAIVKIARKLVNRIYYVMKHDTEYVTGVVQ